MAKSKHARKIGKLSCPYCGGKHTTKLPCGLDVRDLPERKLATVATQGTTKDIRHAARAEFGRRITVEGETPREFLSTLAPADDYETKLGFFPRRSWDK